MANKSIGQLNMFSLIILTYNRPERMKQQISWLSKIDDSKCEIIVVDNCSDVPVEKYFPSGKNIRVIRNELNLGAVGRNKGMEVARGEILITLDDDVYGITNEHLKKLSTIFERQEIGVVNFRIEEEGTGRITDWCHPCEPQQWVDLEFETNDISEGAAAFRKKALNEVGFYPEYFFISHEGPDMAYRMINNGWIVFYSPHIVVTHGYERMGRESWRRYYYDTRNQLWFVLRNLSFFYGMKKLLKCWISMFLYSVRDGFLRYWLKGIYDSILGASKAWKDRNPPTYNARRRMKMIEKNKPKIFKTVWKRLKTKEVRI